jgi:adenine nucleotide transporter 17
VRTEGFLSIYKGLKSALIGSVLSYAIYFFWYRMLKNVYYKSLSRVALSDLDITIITFFSGVVTSLFANPIWLINTRMTLSKDKKGLIETIRMIYREEGLQAFYKGVFPNVILVINPIINFVIYENIKKILLYNKYSLNTLQILLISSLAKTVATICTFPVLTIRVNL